MTVKLEGISDMLIFASPVLGIGAIGLTLVSVGLLLRPKSTVLVINRWQRVRVISQATAIASLTLPLTVSMLRDGGESLFWRDTKSVWDQRGKVES